MYGISPHGIPVTGEKEHILSKILGTLHIESLVKLHLTIFQTNVLVILVHIFLLIYTPNRTFYLYYAISTQSGKLRIHR